MSDAELRKQFAGKLMTIFSGSVLCKLIDIGYQTGLFEASRAGPATSQELSERAGLRERYVREWLGAMACSGIYSYDSATRRFTLPAAHEQLLTGPSAQNLAPYGPMLERLGKQVPRLIDCFKQGGGVPYGHFRPDFTQCMDDMWRRIYDEQLVEGFIARVDGLTERLERGARVLDIGCGTGHALNVLATHFPKSQFLGYDIAVDAIERAREEAAMMRLCNARFEVVDVTSIAESQFDVVTAFDAIHDQRAPDAVLRSVKGALARDGMFVMIEFKFSSDLAENLSNPFAAMYYGLSLMHCMTVSLAVGGPGLGAVWGEGVARRMLAEAGFRDIRMIDSPRPQNAIFVCRS